MQHKSLAKTSQAALRALVIIGMVVTLLVVAGYAFRTPDTDRTEMLAKYGGPNPSFAVNGIDGPIHYREVGPKAAPSIVLIHGANSSLQTWDDIVPELSKSYRVITLDLYGHGLTGPNAQNRYDLATMIQNVTAVLDKVGVKKAVWVGNSYGGLITWRAALAVPDRVAGIVLIAAAGAQTNEPIKPYLGARIMQSWLGQQIVPHSTPKSLVASSLKQTYGDPSKLTPARVQRYWEMMRFPGNRQASVARANTPREADVWAQVNAINVPTLILWGQKDHVIPVSHARAFNGVIHDSTLITYPNDGHLPMEEDPSAVARDLRDWLKLHCKQAEAFCTQ